MEILKILIVGPRTDNFFLLSLSTFVDSIQIPLLVKTASPKRSHALSKLLRPNGTIKNP
jgi:hypothetical protein